MASKPTRRDYFFVNQQALQLIQNFHVVHQTDFPVHSHLRVSFRAPKTRCTMLKAMKPATMTAYLDDHCKEHGPQQGESDMKDYRLATIAAFQNDLRSRLSNHADLFKGHLENNDTDAHWNLWNHDIEAAFGSTFKLTGIPLKRHTGRGKPDIRQTYAAKPTTHADELYEDPNDKRFGTFTKQLNRCTQWVSRIRVLAKTDDGTHSHTLAALNDQAFALIRKDIDKGNGDMCEIIGRLEHHHDQHPRHIVDLLRLASLYQKLLDSANKEAADKYKEARSRQFDDDSYHSKAYRFLSSKLTSPIGFLRRITTGPNQEAPGTFATNPFEIDTILKQAWGKIYEGTSRSLEAVADRFCSKYQHLLYTAPEAPIDPIDAQSFMDSCLQASNSAGGLDGWEPIDFKILPLEAFQIATDLLNAIEQGAAWPEGMVVGRMVFLAKDPQQAEEPLAYRPLLILPHIYRRWAAY